MERDPCDATEYDATRWGSKTETNDIDHMFSTRSFLHYVKEILPSRFVPA